MKTTSSFQHALKGIRRMGIACMLSLPVFSLVSCIGTTAATGGTTSSTENTAVQAGADILNSLLGSLLTKTLTEQSIYGTWTYQSPEVRFESENLLAKAGGQVVAGNIERKLDTYLSQVGIKKGVTSFTFNQDKTFTITTSGRTTSQGTYTFDAKNKTLKLQGGMGLLNQQCAVGMDGTNLCLLFDADKLLSAMNTLGSILGQTNSTIGGVASVFGENYKGMKLGMAMSK